jgi:hypothetical protein
MQQREHNGEEKQAICSADRSVARDTFFGPLIYLESSPNRTASTF